MTQQPLTLDIDTSVTSGSDQASRPVTAAWGAVFSLALCVAVLIASEFMPVSLLSPIATNLGVTEGHMGQAISISGIFAVLTSLFVSSVRPGFVAPA